MTPAAAKALREKLSVWFNTNGRSLPWRENPSPYAVLVSEFMLQQTQVVSVIPYFVRWMKALPSIEALAEASESTVLQLWQGLGYYSRARNLHRSAMEVVSRFGGRLPEDPKDLKSLPGVGPYSAGAIASFAFDRPAAAVDANIARVLARLSNQQIPVDSTVGNQQLWDLATSILPPEKGGRQHTSALMELGALVCTPKKPRCSDCPIRQECQATDPASLPRKRPRKAVLAVDEFAGWIILKNAVLLEQQTGSKSRGLWKLPATEEDLSLKPLFETTYPFTHHKITLRVHSKKPPEILQPAQRWFALDSVLDEAAMPVGHRRALTALLAGKVKSG